MTSSENVENLASVVKLAFAITLEKAGSSIQELEAAMAAGDQTKTASLLKNAAGLDLGLIETLMKGLYGGAQISAGAAAGAGAVGGLGLYGAYKGIKDSQKQQDESAAVRQKLDLARRELEASTRY